MIPVLQPFHVLAVILAGWSNRHQLRVIEYLLEENRIFKEQMQKRRLRLTDAQRARLAVKGKALGRKVLDEVANIVTPDTIMRWHRRLIALKWTYKRRGPGRPGVMKTIERLTVRMATENPTWGYDKIVGSLKNLGHRVAPTTIANILKRHGITPHPHGRFMAQVARNLTDEEDGFLSGKRFLIHDRDTKYTDQFLRILGNTGVESVLCPARAPNCNAYAERFVRSIKDECLSRMIFFGEASLHRAISEYTEH